MMRIPFALAAMAVVAAFAAPAAGEPRQPEARQADRRSVEQALARDADPLRDPSETAALPDDPAISAQRARLQRMHACAHEWHARKRAGKTDGQGWRAFNGACMAGR